MNLIYISMYLLISKLILLFTPHNLFSYSIFDVIAVSVSIEMMLVGSCILIMYFTVVKFAFRTSCGYMMNISLFALQKEPEIEIWNTKT